MRKEIFEIQENLKLGKYQNEASVSQGIVQRILNLLNWPIYDTSIVIPEFSVESKRVDFALCYPPDKPTIFIEIKQVGQSIGAEKQLFEYAFYQGIPMAILTDGQEWQFFLPAEQGEFSDRRVYKLDLLEREIEDIIDVLTKYLEYSNVKSGKAIEAARKDYKNIRQQREAVNTLHEAWTRLIEEGDELLIDLVTDKVESLCGYKPSPDQVINFLSNKAIYTSPPPRKTKKDNSKKRETKQETVHGTGFELFGKFHSARNARNTMYEILNALADRDPTFLHRYENLPKHGRSRRYVATNRHDMNPSRPDLALSDTYSHEFRPGWYVNINLSKRSIEKVIRLACQVANIQYGEDIKIYL
ncbi:MAG: hypothetical protein U9R53_02170 [Chloroflexota bacterium]|nr:hypothetical protein [Chloroflexota bacterium]